jgi:hypothetical protein
MIHQIELQKLQFNGKLAANDLNHKKRNNENMLRTCRQDISEEDGKYGSGI